MEPSGPVQAWKGIASPLPSQYTTVILVPLRNSEHFAYLSTNPA